MASNDGTFLPLPLLVALERLFLGLRLTFGDLVVVLDEAGRSMLAVLYDGTLPLLAMDVVVGMVVGGLLGATMVAFLATYDMKVSGVGG